MNINAINYNGESLLIKAVRFNSIPVVNYMIDLGADVNQGRFFTGMTPLMYASKENFKEIVQILIINGANVNKITNNIETALHLAVLYNNKEIVEILMANNAVVNIFNYKNRTPLHLAVINGNKEIVEILLKHGADIDLRDKKNNKPIDYANQPESKEVAELLNNHAKFLDYNIKIRRKILPLICARDFIEESLFHEDYLPRDMFCVIMMEAINNVDNVALVYSEPSFISKLFSMFRYK